MYQNNMSIITITTLNSLVVFKNYLLLHSVDSSSLDLVVESVCLLSTSVVCC